MLAKIEFLEPIKSVFLSLLYDLLILFCFFEDLFTVPKTGKCIIPVSSESISEEISFL